jgi:hypothetical protein
MSKLREIWQLVRGYRTSIIVNFLFNVLNAVFSLFTFLAVVPFLYILFRVNSDAPSASAQSNALWQWASGSLDAFIASHGQAMALALMCVFIVILALLKNLVNYLSLLFRVICAKSFIRKYSICQWRISPTNAKATSSPE